MVKIAPSLLAANFLKIGDEIARMRDAGADWLHFDVMDGMFVPNISFGQGILKAAAGANLLPCDAHVCSRLQQFVNGFSMYSAPVLTVEEKHIGALRMLYFNPFPVPDPVYGVSHIAGQRVAQFVHPFLPFR